MFYDIKREGYTKIKEAPWNGRQQWCSVPVNRQTLYDDQTELPSALSYT